MLDVIVHCMLCFFLNLTLDYLGQCWEPGTENKILQVFQVAKVVMPALIPMSDASAGHLLQETWLWAARDTAGLLEGESISSVTAWSSTQSG